MADSGGYPIYNGALYDPASIGAPGPALMSPQAQGILSAAFAGLNASGPQRMPVSLGQVVGQAGATGLNTYQQAEQLRQRQALEAIHGQLMQQQILKAAQENQMVRQLQGALAGGTSGALNPDQMEAIGTRLAVAGHPGGAAILGQAEKLRAAQQAQQQVRQFQDQPQEVAALRETVPAGPDQAATDAALLAKWNSSPASIGPDGQPSPRSIEAVPPGGQPSLPQTVTKQGGGLFAPLMTSPYVGEQARQLQAQLNGAAVKGTTPAQWLAQYDKLLQLHQTATNQAVARGEGADLRRELAGQANQTRRDIADAAAASREDNRQNLNEQRTFQRERQLSENYNALSKDFRKVVPQFQSAAEYVAGGKFDSSGDRALVFQFAKTLDPADRVGVNDVRDINKLGNVPERILQAVQGLAEGKMLPERVRQEMFQVMRNRFAAMNEQQAQIEDEYAQRAKGYMLKPENVVLPYAVRKGGGNAGGGQWRVLGVEGARR